MLNNYCDVTVAADILAFLSQQERICKTKQAAGAARARSSGCAVPGIRSSPYLLVAAYQ